MTPSSAPAQERPPPPLRHPAVGRRRFVSRQRLSAARATSQAALQQAPGAGPRVVFADCEFKESQAVLHRLGVKALPWVFRLPAAQRVDPGANIRLKHEDVARAPGRRRLRGCWLSFC